MRKTSVVLMMAVGLAGGAIAGCSSSDASAVKVTLSEWVLTAKPASVDAGKVTFVANNVGGEEHEMLVVRGTKADLPTKADGSLDEKALESRILGEIAGIKAQTDKSKDFDLKKGTYTVICNAESTISGKKVSHFVKGMIDEITVR